MSNAQNPKQDQMNTYFVQDRSNQEEMSRLQVLDRLLTAGMGGVLAEQPDPTAFPHVLDVGCGTGGWLIELAKTIPNCTGLVGVDASHTYVEYARTQAEIAGVSDRVEFHVMDALRMLEFPNHSFDLVNHRFATAWMRTGDWTKLLQEYRRVCYPGGVVRITEPNWIAKGNGPAYSYLQELFMQTFYQAGHLFTPTSEGTTGELPHLFEQHGLQHVQTRGCTPHIRAGSPHLARDCSSLDSTCLQLRIGAAISKRRTKHTGNIY